ncbi:hypothetical protein CCR75_009751 [Bremia lactucae]|uniref:Tetraspanin n=1 Tax=Bremia lactucae TaxID=4779 RepID=A0A976NYZ1_BRELC|nr:hypothetical protein CCR75_009751 [Bremia lactucae]
MEERDGTQSIGNVAEVLILLLNMAFMVVGCLLVYFSHRVETSGWMDAFQSDFEWIGSSTLTFLLVLGAIVIALAAFGCLGALLHQKLLLTIYAMVLFVTIILFIVVAVGATTANSKADDWGMKVYPTTDQEASLGANFNKLYCYAQIPYYCEDASVNSVLDMFNVSLSGYFTDSTTNFSRVCGTMSLPVIYDSCAVCDLIPQYSRYSVVLDWIKASCPRSPTNQVWCGDFLLTTTAAGDMFTNAPFMECRITFYDLVKKWTNVVTVGSFVSIVAAVMVLVITGALRSRVRAASQDKPALPAPVPPHQFRDQNPGLSQCSTNNNFSMRSNVTYNPNAGRRRYNSPY